MISAIAKPTAEPTKYARALNAGSAAVNAAPNTFYTNEVRMVLNAS